MGNVSGECRLYLVKRHKTYWAMHDVPAALQKVHGKRLSRSLQTHDLATARRLAAALWAHEWSRLVDNATDAKADEAEARFYAEMVKKAKGDEEREHLMDHIARLAEARYVAAKSDEDRKAALDWNAAAQGRLTATTEHIETWLAGLHDKPATITQKRRIVDLFATAFPWLEKIEARAAQAWFAEVARREEMAAPTFDRYLSSVRGYWRYLIDTGIIEANPLRDIQRPKSVRKVQSWVPFKPTEVVTLHAAARTAGDAELADLIEMAMWSGARIDELGSLKVPEVDLKVGAFKIADAKTAAGVREVPIHAKLLPTIKRLIGDRKSGYVLDRPRAGTATRRSKAVGERFGALKTKLGYSDRHVFHSIRKTVTTLLENAGVPENVAADIIGHEKPRITYGVYSGGASLEVKRAALGKLRYPK